MLGEAIRSEFSEWCERLHVELMYDTNQAMQKFAVRRHFQRPDWIQANLDGSVSLFFIFIASTVPVCDVPLCKAL